MKLMRSLVEGGELTFRAPVYRNDAVTVYLGDAREVMADLPEDSVDCIVTSPPYWALRDFGVAPSVWGGDVDCSHEWRMARRGKFCARCEAWLGCLGLEPTPDLFVAHMVEFFREVRRLLKPTGSLWLNLGDCFYHASRGRGAEDSGLKPKDLVGIPWRVAFALQKDGWYLRSDIVWQKKNPIPEPAFDRPVRAHEFIFLLTKEPRCYFYDAEAVREPTVGRPRSESSSMSLSTAKYQADTDPFIRANTKYARRRAPYATDRHLRSVWEISTEPFKGAHTATFPTKLVEPCILAGSSAAGCCPSCGRPWERQVEITYQDRGNQAAIRSRKLLDANLFEIDVPRVRHARTIGWRPTCGCGVEPVPSVVFDPFAGTGTTLAVAQKLGRQGVGVELNDAFIPLIKQRLARPQMQPPPSPQGEEQAA